MQKKSFEPTRAEPLKKSRIIKNIGIIICSVLVFALILLAFSELWFYTNRRRSESTAGGYDIGLLYYNSLTMKQKKLYDAVTDAAENCAEYSSVLPYSYKKEEFEPVLRYVRAEHPELFYTDFSASELHSSSHKSMVKMAYLSEPAEIDSMISELDSRISEITALCSDKTDQYELELQLHDLLIANCASRNPSTNDDPVYSTAYGALVLGEAYSEGYAQAYQMLLSRVGIYSCIVYGTGTIGDSLAWNLVTDGTSFCHTDVLWDDPDAYETTELALHGYFKLGYDTMTLDRSLDDPNIIPMTGSSADYYSREGLSAENSEELKSILRLLINSAVAEGERYIEFSTDYTPTEENIGEIFKEVVTEINEVSGEDGPILLHVLDTYPVSARGGGTVLKLYYESQH